MMNIINMTLKNKITTMKNLIEMKQMTLNDPKFDIRVTFNRPSDEHYRQVVVYVVLLCVYWVENK